MSATTSEQLGVDGYLDRLVEISKARLTIGLALALATVTVTGFALERGSSEAFLLAALVPAFGFLVDTAVKYQFSTPFMYKLLCAEIDAGVEEPLALLVLDYRSVGKSRYFEILSVKDSDARRLAFRRAFMRKGLLLKSSVFGSAIVAETLLAWGVA